MLQSMTGYGKATAEFPDKTITVEIRSLNSKGLDASLRMPSVYREKELELRSELAKSLERGKVDVSVNIEHHKEQSSIKINTALAEDYHAQLTALANNLHEKPANLMELVLRMPDVTSTATQSLNEEEYNRFLLVFRKAVAELINFRITEGKALAIEFNKRTGILTGHLDEVEKNDPQRIEKVRSRINKNLEEFVPPDKIDKNRFEQELIYYIEKIDITEEKTRLRAHLRHFTDTLMEPSSGRKLNFITQEIGREVNTIGSKANDSHIQQIVVQMKDELEKIKEQTMNVL